MKAKYPSQQSDYVKAYIARLSPEKKAERAARKRLCPSSAKEYATKHRREYYLANPDKRAERLARQKAWYQKNKVRIAEKEKAYRIANADRIRAQKKAAFQRDREKHRERRRAQYAANREKAIASAYEWQVANRNRHNENKRKNYHKLGPAKTLRNTKYYLNRKASGKARIYGRILKARHRAQVTETFARELLAKHSTLKSHEFPLELVQLKQAQIKLKHQLVSTK